jgi:tRNA (guanine-N7-)-methyltransferase
MIVKASDKVAADVLLSPYHLERPVEWSTRFAVSRPLDVEIGFGLGEYLIRLAQQEPDRNFIGIEQDWQRIHKALRNIERVRRSSAEDTLLNLRLLHVDAWVAFERLFGIKSIHRIIALFPCPWPKKKHFKHRLFSRDFLKLLNSRLIDGGQVNIVTDDKIFLEWILAETADTGFEAATEVIEPRFDTKFERKWREAGQQEFFAIELKKEKHLTVPVVEDCELKIYFVDNFDAGRLEFSNILEGESGTSIILKDFIFDARQNKGLAHLVVAEPTITQHVWVSVTAIEGGKSSRWCISPAEGQTVLPSQGVVRALDAFYQAAQRTVTSN